MGGSVGGWNVPRDVAELRALADMVARAGLVPPGMSRDQLAPVMAAGLEIGFKPMQSLACMYVINGRIALHSDGLVAPCLASGQLEDFKEERIGQRGTDSEGWRFTAKRLGHPTPFVGEFTVADAKVAKVWGKRTWETYPDRMLRVRARSSALRDGFADILRGIGVLDEVLDIAPDDAPATEPTAFDRFRTAAKALGWSKAQAEEWFLKRFGVALGEATDAQLEAAIPAMAPTADPERGAALGELREAAKAVGLSRDQCVQWLADRGQAMDSMTAKQLREAARVLREPRPEDADPAGDEPAEGPAWFETETGSKLYERLKAGAKKHGWPRDKTLRWLAEAICHRPIANEIEFLRGMHRSEVEQAVKEMEDERDPIPF